ncbi:hypothetical protein HQ585_08965 [candidate division KSB1 bacterium]|nr:hypothetical protein [candidate division KSB1 bacterium]
MYKYYSLEDRYHILDSYAKNGMKYAVYKYSVSPAAIYRWLKLVKAGRSVRDHFGAISAAVYRRIQACLDQIYFKSMDAIVRDNNLPIHCKSLGKIIRRLDLPAYKVEIITYFCRREGRSIKAVKTFFSMSYRPCCPVCGKPLVYNGKMELFLYYPKPNEFYLSRGKLFSVNSQDFKDRIYPLLALPQQNLPLFKSLAR